MARVKYHIVDNIYDIVVQLLLCVFLVIKLFTLAPELRPSYRQEDLGGFMAVILIIQAFLTIVYLVYRVIASIVWLNDSQKHNKVEPSSN